MVIKPRLTISLLVSTLFSIFADLQIRVRRSLDAAQESKKMQKADYEQRRAEKDAIIKTLTNRLEHELAPKAHDGTNMGTPTSQTPIGKKKVIPNSRVSTGKKKGGQPGHKRHILEAPTDDEIDVVAAHELGAEECCPKCCGQDYRKGLIAAEEEAFSDTYTVCFESHLNAILVTGALFCASNYHAPNSCICSKTVYLYIQSC
jgi:hypothetical protein